MSEILWNICLLTLVGTIILVVRKLCGDKLYPTMLTLFWLFFIIISILPLHRIAVLSANIEGFSFSSEIINISDNRQNEYEDLLNTHYNVNILEKFSIKKNIDIICKIAWVVGLSASILYKVHRAIRLEKSIKRECKGVYSCIAIGSKSKVNIFITESKGPMVYGIKPNIYVPEKFIESDALKSILAHERVHIIRKHHLLLILLDIISSIYWFLPYYKHIFVKSLCDDMEYRCDYEVIKNCDVNSKAYASHYAIVKGYRSGLNFSLYFGKGQFMDRICRILNPVKDKKKTIWILVLFVATVVGSVLWIGDIYFIKDSNGFTKWEVKQAKDTIINVLNAANEGDEELFEDYIYREGPLSRVGDFADVQYDLYYIDYMPRTSSYYERKYKEQHQLQMSKLLHLEGILKIEGSERIWGFTLIFDEEERDWKLYDWGQ